MSRPIVLPDVRDGRVVEEGGQAVEEALEAELAAADGDHRVAFRRHGEVMRPYVTRAQQLPPGGAAGYAPSSALAIRMRALSMRARHHWPMKNLLAAQFAKAEDITLPDYGLHDPRHDYAAAGR